MKFNEPRLIYDEKLDQWVPIPPALTHAEMMAGYYEKRDAKRAARKARQAETPLVWDKLKQAWVETNR